MGLSIIGPSKEYHRSYSALHGVRWLALVTCGWPEKIGGKSSDVLYPMTNGADKTPTHREMDDMIRGATLAGYRYPNLILHSDCDGDYTHNGKLTFGPDEWMEGNSDELLEELETLKELVPDNLKQHHPAWGTFKEFYDVVKDIVKNGDGRVEFS